MTFSDNLKSRLQSQYTSGLAENFYKPVLTEANLYQRVSGYFSSAGLDLYSDGLDDLVGKGNGEVQFIISREISKEDFQRIQSGYDMFEELSSMKFSEKNSYLTPEAQKQLGNLAFLIAAGKARVKVALTDKGIFHDKFGIISSDNEHVFFNGSANETRNGISENYESISVDVSWDESINVKNRIEENLDRFERLWNDAEPGVSVVEASDLAYEEIAKYQPQSTINEVLILEDDNVTDNSVVNTIDFIYVGKRIIRNDNSVDEIVDKDRKLKKGSDISLFFEDDNCTVKDGVSYVDIERIIEVTKKRAKRHEIDVYVSKAVEQYLARSKYSIEQYKILGETYKKTPAEFPEIKKAKFNDFTEVVQSEVTRKLYDLHIRAAYYEYEMGRSANFSVPGAGKTAMLLGVFAYLNRKDAPDFESINRMLVICPINAFDSWKREFQNVFGDKKILKAIDCQSSKDFMYELNTKWGTSNLVLVNYEALKKYKDKLAELIDGRTMLIFDEVHRIKSVTGERANSALSLADGAKFKYVLTGTPIPNSYKDIYTFLHILYGNEYNSFFGWDPQELEKPKIRKIEEINEKIHPFFWRTNKKDLNVPEADEDIVVISRPSEFQNKLAESIYQNEEGNLAVLIRLIQASTNPALINHEIDYKEVMDIDNETEEEVSADIKKIFDTELDVGDATVSAGYNKIPDDVMSPKFESGIDLVEKLVKENKKVMVWGLFVNTMEKIETELKKRGISVNLVYGKTKKAERVGLINAFKEGDIQVLISNPQTLGESISLHKNVHDAVYFEYNFNLTFMLQSRDRIHRLGLGKNDYTRYYYLQTEDESALSDQPGFIDQKIYSKLKDKEQIMYGAIDDDTLSIEYSDDEIQEAMKIIDDERKRMASD
ncbi:DEAD/DEAH box helicase family protein [Weissella viridescens]|uniref:SNF2-related protein n=1 Tax=Weissella viridescens TaxID=1629 RepID=UPI001747223B|nr:SNF2-related protein [Weissella viridescens]QOD86267.1 DEAD/DEAH box helicase family protein [Weissella viridescens]WJI91394.1 SNF2-related protein [Weissella viridescens]